ncbi:unnamed protein product, partial [Rotaria sp. Silwood2]
KQIKKDESIYEDEVETTARFTLKLQQLVQVKNEINKLYLKSLCIICLVNFRLTSSISLETILNDQIE